MVVVSAVMAALLYVVDALFMVYFFIVLAACLVTWVNADPYNPVVQMLRKLTEPVFYRIRKFLPFTYKSGIDFSPVVLMIGLQAARILLIRLFAPLAG